MLGLFSSRADRDLALWRSYILDHVQTNPAGGDVFDATKAAIAEVGWPRSVKPRPTVDDTARWVEEQLTLLAAIDADGGE